jgi:hypothetical protein
MQKFILVSLVTLAMVCFSCQSYSQGTLAPLYLVTSGSGSITPFQDGQLLEVGTNYQMTAVPDSDFTFSSWQPVNVFVLTEVVLDSSGDLSTNTSTALSPIANYIETSTLTFTMQPVQVLTDNGVLTITENSGWQANFVPVPEPSNATLTVFGITVVVWLRRKRLKTIKQPNTKTDCAISFHR